MPLRRSLALAAPVLVALGAPTVCRADREVVEAFVAIRASDDGAVLELAGNARYGMSTAVYRANRPLLLSLEAGDRIRVALDDTGAVVDVRRAAGARDAGDDRRELTGSFEKLETVGERYWITVEGERFQVPIELYNDRVYAQILQFLDAGDTVRVTTRKGYVVDIARAHADTSVDPGVWDTIQRSERGDEVEINGDTYRFKRYTLHHVYATPRLPTGDFGGTIGIDLRDVDAFENPAADERAGPDDGDDVGIAVDGADPFERLQVEVGDTVGIGLDSGQLLELTEEECILRVWRNETWSGVQSWQREEIEQVRRVTLTRQETVPLDRGDLHVRINRRCAAAHEGLSFEVVVSHDIEQAILTGASLRFLLGPVGMEPTDEPQAVEEVPLPDVFAGGRAAIYHRVRSGLRDGRVELAFTPQDLLSIDDEEARPLILKALVAEQGDLEALGRILKSAVRNGDEALVRYTIDQALYPEVEDPNEAGRKAQLATAALRAAPDRVAGIVVRDLYFQDRNLKRTLLFRGRLREEALSRLGTAPIPYKRDLIGLLAEVPGGLSGEHGEQLFDLHLQREDLSQAIHDAFAARPEEAVALLLPYVIAPDVEADDPRHAQAVHVLRSLGTPALDPLIAELRARNLPSTDIEQGRSAGVAPDELVHAALEQLVEDAIAEQRALLDQRVGEARGLADEEAWGDALRLVDFVLARDPTHQGAQELRPQLQVSLARELATGARGEAARLLEQAIEDLPKKRRGRAESLLGGLYLDAAREASEGVAIRASAHDVGSLIRHAKPGEGFSGAPEGFDWTRVELRGEPAAGFIRSTLAKRVKPGRYAAKEESPLEVITALLDRARELAPNKEVDANEVEGHVLAREAARKYEAGDYQGALPLFEQAEAYAPSDERLALAKWCWIKAYRPYLFSVGGVLFLAAGIGLLQLFARPKKVKFEGEFRHYGANRAERERDLALGEDDGAAVSPEEAP